MLAGDYLAFRAADIPEALVMRGAKWADDDVIADFALDLDLDGDAGPSQSELRELLAKAAPLEVQVIVADGRVVLGESPWINVTDTLGGALKRLR